MNATFSRIVVAISVTMLSACATHKEARHPCPSMGKHPCPAMETQERADMLKRMADMCAERAASVSATRQEVEAAQQSTSTTNMKAALRKAAEELRFMEDHAVKCKEHVKMMSMKPCPCPKQK